MSSKVIPQMSLWSTRFQHLYAIIHRRLRRIFSLFGWRFPISGIPAKDFTAGTSQYLFRKLETVSHIRILELLPKNPESLHSLHCRIHHMDLNVPAFKYAAVSYAWGNTSIKLRKPIYTSEGSILLVTPNLYSFFHRMQNETSGVFLWADAVCIDQGEDEGALRERSAQVNLMSRIYSEADEVLVGLGDIPKDDEILVDGFQRLASVDKEQWQRLRSVVGNFWARSPDGQRIADRSFEKNQQYFDNFETLLSMLEVPDQQHPFWAAFQRLLQRPWFHRVWIIQEMSLCENLSFFLGSHCLPEKLFRKGTKRAIDYNGCGTYTVPTRQSRFGRLWYGFKVVFDALVSYTRFISSNFQSPPLEVHEHWESERWAYENIVRWQLFRTRKYARLRAVKHERWVAFEQYDNLLKWNPLTVHELFSEFRYFECSIPRDRLYGLLGLAYDGDAPELYIDYQEPLQDVPVRFSRYLILKGYGKSLLYEASHHFAHSPSWTVSLEDLGPCQNFLTSSITSGSRPGLVLFRAAGNTELVGSFAPHLDPYLIIRGTLLATIYSHTFACPLGAGHSFIEFENNMSVWSIVVERWIREIALLLPFLPTSELHFKCYRTLLADVKYHDVERNKKERIGSGDAAQAFLQGVDFYFPQILPDDGLLKFQAAKLQRLRNTSAALMYWRNLQLTIPGMRLGISISTPANSSDNKSTTEGDDLPNSSTSTAAGRGTEGEDLPDSSFPTTAGREREGEDLPNHSSSPAARAATPNDVQAFFCLLPETAEIGDHLAIINGCPVPFVLRKAPDSESFRIVGCCYISGMMDGQVIDEGWPQRDIVLT